MEILETLGGKCIECDCSTPEALRAVFKITPKTGPVLLTARDFRNTAMSDMRKKLKKLHLMCLNCLSCHQKICLNITPRRNVRS
jgi:hypothetical protein